MARPMHFEIQAEDLDRARAFYEAVFGWSFEDWSHVTGSPYLGVSTGPSDTPGIDGGLMPRTGPAPAPGAGANASVLTVVVDDYGASAAAVLSAGGQEVRGKEALPGMAWQGYYLDSEGNLFGIHQPDPEAR
jgi:uncharacterized protein